MIKIIGDFSLIIAFFITVYSAAAVMIGVARKQGKFVASAVGGVSANTVFATLSSISLMILLAARDYSVQYVVEHVDNSLSIAYRLAAFWAGNQGSLLLWQWLLSVCTFIAVYTLKKKYLRMLPLIILILMVINGSFAFLTAFIENPFIPAESIYSDGFGLNPMLQNSAMLIHPPIQYLGFVIFAVPFAISMSAVIRKQQDLKWIHPVKIWSLTGWIFLTGGILYGAQWAYVELGWGGYWAWDPVENASLIPWLTSTALIHSLLMFKNRYIFKKWTVVLVSSTFLLTIFATFITRSGVVSSVHAFGRSQLGMILLAYLTAGLVFVVYVIVSNRSFLKDEREIQSLFSVDGGILISNVVLMCIAFAVMWGTMFPVISSFFLGNTINPGPGFYNHVCGPLALALVFLISVCPLINKTKIVLFILLVGIVSGVTAYLMDVRHYFALGAVVICSSALFAIVYKMCGVIKSSVRGREKIRILGAYITHLAVVLIIIGITGSGLYFSEKSLTLKYGDEVNFKQYTVKFEKLKPVPRGKAMFVEGVLWVNNGVERVLMQPALAFYPGYTKPSGEVDILTSLKEDFYTVLAAYDVNSKTATFKFKTLPLMFWLWAGSYLLIIGAIMSLLSCKTK